MPGKFPPSIIVGVIVSVFSLAWGSSRAFFIERTRDEADPDPALNMVVMWVFPCMVLVALNSMMMWTMLGGILGRIFKNMTSSSLKCVLGPWVFLVMVLQFIANLIVVTLVTRAFSEEVVTEETPREREAKNTREPLLVELATEDELVTKPTGQEVTEEEPLKTKAEMNPRSPVSVELTTEEDLTTRETGQEEKQSPATGEEEKTRDPADVEHVTEEEEDVNSPIGNNATDQEVQKENPRETTGEEDTAQTVNSTTEETGEEANEDDRRKVSPGQTEEAGMEMISISSEMISISSEMLEMEMEQESKQFYKLKAALTSLWLPAVVGNKKNLFIAASISTLISKILMLLMSSILAYFFQEKIHSHPFILWSRVGKIPDC